MAPFSGVAFYVSAHQDDWQLFRGEVGFDDIGNTDAKIVFVFATAGDAGEAFEQDAGWWEARESGAIMAVRRAMGDRAPVAYAVAAPPCPSPHPIHRYTCRNVVLYFLRLPDGSPGGEGFESTGHQSLAKLRASDQPVAAVDGSTTYTSWADFVATLEGILNHEAQGLPGPHWINCSDYAPGFNLGDHADHHAVAEAVRQIAARSPGSWNRAWYLTYCIAQLPANLTGGRLANKKLTFDAYSDEVLRMTELDGNGVAGSVEEWTAWGSRSYHREVLAPNPDPDQPTRPPYLPKVWPPRRPAAARAGAPSPAAAAQANHGTRARPGAPGPSPAPSAASGAAGTGRPSPG